MENKFINETLLSFGPWQALERAVARLMQHGDFEDVRLVGRTGDGGADILASRNSKRWVVQVKFRKAPSLDDQAVDEVLSALNLYRADIPVIATNTLASIDVLRRRQVLFSSGLTLQVWDKHKLLKDFDGLEDISHKLRTPREY